MLHTRSWELWNTCSTYFVFDGLSVRLDIYPLGRLSLYFSDRGHQRKKKQRFSLIRSLPAACFFASSVYFRMKVEWTYNKKKRISSWREMKRNSNSSLHTDVSFSWRIKSGYSMKCPVGYQKEVYTLDGTMIHPNRWLRQVTTKELSLVESLKDLWLYEPKFLQYLWNVSSLNFSMTLEHKSCWYMSFVSACFSVVEGYLGPNFPFAQLLSATGELPGLLVCVVKTSAPSPVKRSDRCQKCHEKAAQSFGCSSNMLQCDLQALGRFQQHRLRRQILRDSFLQFVQVQVKLLKLSLEYS